MAETIVNIADLELKQLKTGSRFELGLCDIDRLLGLSGLGVMMHVVPAGKTAWPYHRHLGKDEMFLVLSGTGEYRVGDRRVPIKAGDCIGAPAGGEAHQIINSSAAELRYIAFANQGQADVMEYPDSGKVAVVIASGSTPSSIYDVTGRLTSAGYWDGEDVGGEV